MKSIDNKKRNVFLNQHSKKSVDKKIPGGKLLRLDFEKENDKIVYVKISGDFFIHPEDALEKIEKLILETSLNDLEEVLERFVSENKIKIIGFSVKDLVALFEI